MDCSLVGWEEGMGRIKSPILCVCVEFPWLEEEHLVGSCVKVHLHVHVHVHHHRHVAHAVVPHVHMHFAFGISQTSVVEELEVEMT